MKDGKIIVISAPSGSGKTTLVKYLLSKNSNLEFSVSATSRPPRKNEIDGIDYHFLNKDYFIEAIKKESFVEYEEVYSGVYYGSLKSELLKIWGNKKIAVFDIDVKGGLNIKSKYFKNTLSIFIKPPSLSKLRNRLLKRRTDSKENIEIRISMAKNELDQEDKFDNIIINDDLSVAKSELDRIVDDFILNK
ncbi:MAG: guanylate kinase [Flavobacteriaceae bacterium]|nr:guanylate kinase [Flavobacteriaceae bacterium]